MTAVGRLVVATALCWASIARADLATGGPAASASGSTATSAASPAFPPAAAPPGPVTLWTSAQPLDPGKLTVVITHGWEPFPTYCPARQVPDWECNMAAHIDALGANVVEVAWAGAFANRLQSATAEVADAGAELAAGLSTLGAQRTRGIQFIGHSLGALVNAYATDALASRGVHVDQFTILDRPFGRGIASASERRFIAVDGDGPIFRTLLPRGAVTWVDNYYGNDEFDLTPAVGAPLAPDALAFDHLYAGADHVDVHDRYDATIPSAPPAHGVCPSTGGFLCSRVGGGFDVRRPDDWDPLASLLVPGRPLSIDAAWLVHDCTIASDAATCEEGSSAYLWVPQFAIDADAMYLSFDFQWIRPGDGDWLTLHFGDALLFSFAGAASSGAEVLGSGPIPVRQFAGQTDRLLFTLNGVGDANAAVRIDNLRLITFVPVAIDIRPGSTPNSISSVSAGSIPVALLSTASFSAPDRIATASLRFGRAGDEPSFLSCRPDDVDGDGLPDLACRFDAKTAGFQPGDQRGNLTGQTIDGVPVVGSDVVRVVR